MSIKKKVLSIGLAAGMLASMVGGTGISASAATTTTSNLKIAKNKGIIRNNNGGATISVTLTAKTSMYDQYKKNGTVTYWLKAYESDVVLNDKGQKCLRRKDDIADALCQITSPNGNATIDYTDTNNGKLRGIRQGQAYQVFYVVRYKTSKNGSWNYQKSEKSYNVSIGAQVKDEPQNPPVDVNPPQDPVNYDDIDLSLSWGGSSSYGSGIGLWTEKWFDSLEEVNLYGDVATKTSNINAFLKITVDEYYFDNLRYYGCLDKSFGKLTKHQMSDSAPERRVIIGNNGVLSLQNCKFTLANLKDFPGSLTQVVGNFTNSSMGNTGYSYLVHLDFYPYKKVGNTIYASKHARRFNLWCTKEFGYCGNSETNIVDTSFNPSQSEINTEISKFKSVLSGKY